MSGMRFFWRFTNAYDIAYDMMSAVTFAGLGSPMLNFSVRRSLIFTAVALLGSSLGGAIAVEPLCYMQDSDGNIQSLGELCGDPEVVEERDVSRRGDRLGDPARETANPGSALSTGEPDDDGSTPITDGSKAIVVLSCEIVRDGGSQYVRGSVLNRTGGIVRSVVVYYRAFDLSRGSGATAHESELFIQESSLRAGQSGMFNDSEHPFNVSNAVAEVQTLFWTDANGQAFEYQDSAPKRCV